MLFAVWNMGVCVMLQHITNHNLTKLENVFLITNSHPKPQLNIVTSFEQLVLKSHPAGPTGTLVSYLLQSGTVGPLLSGVKLFRQLQVSSILNPAEEQLYSHVLLATSTNYDNSSRLGVHFHFVLSRWDIEFCSMTLTPLLLLLLCA